MSDDRWTASACENVLADIPDAMQRMTERQFRALLLTALDALKAQPRWVRAGDHDEKKQRWVASHYCGKTAWHLVVPLPLPPLPEEE